MSIVLFIAVLVFLIVVHELGHFVAAKWFGIRVDEFGIGYPPRALTLGKRGDTTYTVNWLPFGGFVRIFGERRDIEYSKEHVEYAFVKKPKWVQAIVLAAGVVCNIVLAWLLFTSALLLGAPFSVDESQADNVATRLMINAVMQHSPADIVGLLPGDEIVAITSDGDALLNLTPSATVDFIQGHAGEDVVISYLRSGNDQPVDAPALSPANGVLAQSPGTPAIGITMALVAEDRLGVGAALAQGFVHTIVSLRDVTVGLVGFVTALLAGTADWTQVAGPVGIAALVSDASTVGVVYLIYFTAFISINLAIINLIPLPALDGGRLVFIAVETLLRRQIHERTALVLNILGFTALIVLMIVVTYHDIVNLVM